MNSTPDPVPQPVESWLHPVFLASGFAALVYQVVWQRVLFILFGINVEAVAVVVTAFMIGLGFGSSIGGRLSRDPRLDRLRLFAAVEGMIGLFGLVSLPLFRTVGRITLSAPPLVTGSVSFLLVCLPTLLMGATLPLLVAHAVARSGNVGRSVGSLYFVNTLGSALASVAAVLLLLPWLGQEGAVRCAALLNLGVAAWVFRLSGSRKEVRA